jgi:hypothetical protein
MEPVYHRIVHMDLDMPVLARRQVKSLDRERRTLTILDNDVERVLALSPRVKVLSPRGAGKLEDVVPGLIVDCGLRGLGRYTPSALRGGRLPSCRCRLGPLSRWKRRTRRHRGHRTNFRDIIEYAAIVFAQ